MASEPFDKYSLTHIAVGVLFQLGGVKPALALGSHVAFEIGEDELKRRVPNIWPDASPDSLANHVGDFASFTGGYYAARALRPTSGGQTVLGATVAVGAAVWVLALAGGEWKVK